MTIFLVAVILPGCGGNFYSIYRSFDTKDDSIVIDAKQRLVAISRVKTSASGTSGTDNERTIVCAEPSPDALSAMSAAASASGTYKEVGAQLAGSFAETASNIGLRTQTIQLLRDGMYRACEAYMNGAITSADYSKEQRRYQIIMGGLLAIEQLTGVVTPKQVILHCESAASVGKDLLQAQRNLDEAKKNLTAAQNEAKQAKEASEQAKQSLSDYKSTLDPDSTKWTAEQKTQVSTLDQKVKDSQTTLDNKTKAVTAAEQTVKEMEGLVEAAKSLAAKASAGGTIDSGATAHQLSAFSSDNNNHMIDAVRKIVRDMLQPDFVFECLDMYRDAEYATKFQAAKTANSKAAKELDEFCGKLLEKGKEKPEAFIKAF
jgi:translation initiation factor 1 (eIF-1/SUI1)